MAGKLVIGIGAAAALLLPSAAHAATFCVSAPSCTGEAHTTLQAALTAADAVDGRDRVEVGPGSYPGPFIAAQEVEVVGAGRGETVLTAAGDGVTVITLQAGGSVLRGATVQLGAGSGGTGVSAPLAEDVRIEGAAAPATGFAGSVFRRGVVDLGDADGTTGIAVPGAPGVSAVEDATVRAQVGIVTGVSTLPVGVRRTRIAARIGIDVPGALEADDVTVALPDHASAAGVRVGPQRMVAATATLRHVTISGSGTGAGVVVSGGAPETPGADAASAAVHSTVIRGVGAALVTAATVCTGVPDPCFPATATATTAYSAYDPATVTATGPGGVTAATPPITADPRLDGDLRPRYDSPLVDAADPAGLPGTTDVSGLARVVDGDGDGSARPDVGALEYQRRAPQVDLLTAIPDAAQTGAPVAFGVDATDPEGEALNAAWAFSDGTTATGFDVTRSFTTPGTVTATVTVTDAAGAATAASVNVAISAPARPPGGGDPGPGVKPPPVVARVLPDRVRLRAVKARDRRAPYRFKLRGTVVLPTGVLAAGCRGGEVQLAIRVGKKRLSRSATVKADCSFRLTLKLGRKKARRVRVTPRFEGTAALAPLGGRVLKLRAG
jgi:hypothetical protein